MGGLCLRRVFGEEVHGKRGQSIEMCDFGLICGAAFRSLWLDATQDASPISWGDVSRHEPGRPARGYFPE